ncbi:hypothetical protein CEXT_523091 [Caerostris extrusa]|uniref:Uncharacterized protein n=1 Tax=Caerostris extrusa TaxID=172846 RepID=A0AAV4VMZ3_CAEEX|nr:hypothetical protein CEXT_523091 [Caerostris extrusa]
MLQFGSRAEMPCTGGKLPLTCCAGKEESGAPRKAKDKSGGGERDIKICDLQTLTRDFVNEEIKELGIGSLGSSSEIWVVVELERAALLLTCRAGKEETRKPSKIKDKCWELERLGS